MVQIKFLKTLIWTSFNVIWKSHVWKSHSLLEHAWSKSSSTGQFNWPMAIETQRPISNGSHYSLATHAKPYSVGSGYRTSPANCDDPVHGSGRPDRQDLNRLDFINEETLVILYQFPPAPLDGIGWCTHEVIAPWPHMPNLIQLVQGTEQVLPTAMIRYMVVVLAR